MKRRDFLTSAVAVAGSGMILSDTTASAQDDSKTPARSYFELRLYHLRRGPKTELFDRFYRDAAVPALNRAGIERVGVFSVSIGPDSPTMYVLLPHPSLESLVSTPARVRADEEFLKAGAEFINAPPDDPAFIRVDSSLLMAFEGMPKLEVPSFADGGKSRVFELRTYESHSLKAGYQKSVEQCSILRRDRHFPTCRASSGVLWAGPHRHPSAEPPLTMLSAENSRRVKKAGCTFGGSDEMEKTPQHAGVTPMLRSSAASRTFCFVPRLTRKSERRFHQVPSTRRETALRARLSASSGMAWRLRAALVVANCNVGQSRHPP